MRTTTPCGHSPEPVDVQVIPYLVVHVFPRWLALVVLPDLRRCRQWRRVDDLTELAGEVFGGGSSEADGNDDFVAAAAQQPGPSGSPSSL